MKIDRGIFYWIGIGCCWLAMSSCDEDPIPIIPDPDIDPPIGVVPNPHLFQLNVSQSILCEGDQTDILLSDYDNKPKELANYTIYIFPEIGILNLETGYYQAPENLDQEMILQLWAVSKADTSVRSGQLLRLQPLVPGSRVLSQFSGIIESVDSEQLPDGSLIFATNNPANPPGLLTSSEFEIFCTDQEGNLRWNTQLGRGTLRRLYVGKDAIYGLGHLNSEGLVAVKFDFDGNHLGTKTLGIDYNWNTSILENLKGSITEAGEFFIGYGTTSLRMMLKWDQEMNLSSAKPIPTHGSDFYTLGNSNLLINSSTYNQGFMVTDSALNVLWEKSFGDGVFTITRSIKTASGGKIWTIICEYSSNSFNLKTFDLDGNPILDKKLSLPAGFSLTDLHDVAQLPNEEIWLVSSSVFVPKTNPVFEEESIPFSYHLFQFTPDGELVKEARIGNPKLVPAPSFPGGWPTHYQGLFQGENGLILTGQWFYNFLIQLSPDYRYSSCPL